MAYFLNKGTEERQEQFLVETAAEIAKLPTATSLGDKSVAVENAYQKVAAGSTALVIATGEVYVLTTSNVWTKVGG